MNRLEGVTRIARAVALAALLAAAGACGDLTAGGFGEASVRLSGDAPDTLVPLRATRLSAPAPAPSPAAAGPTTTEDDGGDDGDDDQPEGEVETELTLFLVLEDGGVIALTDTDVRVRVDLEGVEEPEIALQTVSAASYSSLRMVFTDIEVEVDAGLVIMGDTIMGEIDVEFDDVILAVEKPLSLEIADDERVELLIDLNAASWLRAVDPVTRTVDAQVFADLVTVTIR